VTICDEAYRENAYRVARSMKAVATKNEMDERARILDSSGKRAAAAIFREVAAE
jgi:DNA-binding transcriptional regulator/RsmH inhibitor MraZ